MGSVTFRCSDEAKARYVEAAGGSRGLSVWIKSALDAALGGGLMERVAIADVPVAPRGDHASRSVSPAKIAAKVPGVTFASKLCPHGLDPVICLNPACKERRSR